MLFRSLFAHTKNFVLGVARPNDVSGVDGDEPVGNGAADVFVAGRGRRAGKRYPIRERHRHVEILSLDDVGQILERAVDVRVTGKPAASGHVHPTLQFDFHIFVGSPDLEFFRGGEIFLSALNRQRVIAHRQLGSERVGRDGGVFFKRILAHPVRLVVTHRGAFGRGGFHEKPIALGILQIDSRSN